MLNSLRETQSRYDDAKRLRIRTSVLKFGQCRKQGYLASVQRTGRGAKPSQEKWYTTAHEQPDVKAQSYVIPNYCRLKKTKEIDFCPIDEARREERRSQYFQSWRIHDTTDLLRIITYKSLISMEHATKFEYSNVFVCDRKSNFWRTFYFLKKAFSLTVNIQSAENH